MTVNAKSISDAYKNQMQVKVKAEPFENRVSYARKTAESNGLFSGKFTQDQVNGFCEKIKEFYGFNIVTIKNNQLEII